MADSEWTAEDEARLFALFESHAERAYSECPWDEDQAEPDVVIDTITGRVANDIRNLQVDGDAWALRVEHRWVQASIEAFIEGAGLDPQGTATDDQIRGLITLTRHKYGEPSPLDRAHP